ncbi:MAG: laminin G domain-containing protein [Deltaproteobacteria bacterium]|nr:laminin G domain-containing protein [Deltaproteobacteria bacterium]
MAVSRAWAVAALPVGWLATACLPDAPCRADADCDPANRCVAERCRPAGATGGSSSSGSPSTAGTSAGWSSGSGATSEPGLSASSASAAGSSLSAGVSSSAAPQSSSAGAGPLSGPRAGLEMLLPLDGPPAAAPEGTGGRWTFDDEGAGLFANVWTTAGALPGAVGAGTARAQHPGLDGAALRLVDPSGRAVAAGSAALEGNGFAAEAWVRAAPGSAMAPSLVVERGLPPDAPGPAAALDTAAAPVSSGGAFFAPGFDGRYLYFPPWGHTRVLRVDTKVPWGATGSTTVFDLGTLPGGPFTHFAGTITVGRYVYFQQHHDGTQYVRRFLRLDARGDFTAASSWVTGDWSTPTNADVYLGACTDGRDVYAAPELTVPAGSPSATGGSAVVVRQSTANPALFADPSSRTVVDVAALYPGTAASGFVGCVSDGRYVYFMPWWSPLLGFHGRVLRLDTEVDLQTAAAWSVLDLTPWTGGSMGSHGGIFDGRYVYILPYGRPLFLRLDTTVPFGSRGGVTTMDLAALAPGRSFRGAVHDGRFIRFVAEGSQTVAGLMLRYDTTRSFTSTLAWAVEDSPTSAVDAQYTGGVFDGRNVWWAPSAWGAATAGRLVRLDTRPEGSAWGLWWNLAQQGWGGGAPMITGYLGTAAARFTVTAPTPTDGDWHHVALTYDGAALGLYVDGTARASTPATGVPLPAGQALAWGASLRGSLDDARASMRAVPAATVTADAQLPDRRDSSGHGHDARLAGATTGTGPSAAYAGSAALPSPAAALSVPSGPALPGAFTAEAWVNVEGPVGPVATVLSSLGVPGPLPAGPVTAVEVPTVLPQAQGYWGGAFDGQYFYLSPHAWQGASAGQDPWSGRFVRHDTRRALADPAAWELFDLGATVPAARGFGQPVLLGRHVYFPPVYNGLVAGAHTSHGNVVRYNTAQPFTDPAAWEVFDVKARVDPRAEGYLTAVTDGTYVYFPPYVRAGVGFGGVFLRLDPSRGFSSPSAWTVMDPVSLGVPSSVAFAGGTTVGRFTYFAPHYDGVNVQARHYLRVDNALPFGSTLAWAVTSRGSISGLDAGNDVGAVTDGRYVYYLPSSATASGVDPYHGVVARYDTARPFTDSSAWSALDTRTLDNGTLSMGPYHFGVFDGRYIYLAPPVSGARCNLVRLDTRGDFRDLASWSVLHLADDCGHASIIFDGRALYLGPSASAGGKLWVRRVPILPDGPGLALGLSRESAGIAPGVPVLQASVAGTAGRVDLRAPTPLPSGWHHVALTWSSPDATLWLDASPVVTKRVTLGSTAIPAGEWTLGGGFTGALDQVAVWSVALDNAELSTRLP